MIENQNWWKLSSIQIGGVICLPVIMIGQVLSQKYGFASAACAIVLGNAILLLMGLVIAKMSCENRKTTMENAAEYFGQKGVSFFALALSSSTLIWFAIQLRVMTESTLALLSLPQDQLIVLMIGNFILGALVTLIVYYGIKAMETLSSISMPLLLLTLLYAWYSTNKTIEPSSQPLTLSAVSAIIGMAITYVIDLPTFLRHARSTKDGIISISIIFVIAIPVLEIIGVYLAAGQSGSILDILKGDGKVLWTLWVTAFLILAGWTTNNMNLYSGAASVCSVIKNIGFRKAILWFGCIGTLLANVNLLEHLELFLEGMGVIVASMGSVVITRYLLILMNGNRVTSADYPFHFLAWALGAAGGFLSMQGFSITPVAVLDASIIAHFGTYLILLRGKSYEKAYS